MIAPSPFTDQKRGSRRSARWGRSQGSHSEMSGSGEAATRFSPPTFWASRTDRNHTRIGTGSGKPAYFQAAEVLIQQIGQHGPSLRVSRPFYANVAPIQLSQTAPALPMTLFGYQDWQVGGSTSVRNWWARQKSLLKIVVICPTTSASIPFLNSCMASRPAGYARTTRLP